MTDQPTWQDLVAAARRKATEVASELASDPRTRDALSMASAGANAAAKSQSREGL